MARRSGYTVDRKTPAGKWLEHQTRILSGKPRVKIGITQKDFNDSKEGLSEDAAARDPYTVGEVAVVNEFGSSDGRIPERSFIRSTTDDERRKVNAMLKRLKLAVIAGFLPARRALGIVGVYMKGKIQDKITTLDTPPNAPSTIVQKTRAGRTGDNPLINTGQMRNKVDWVVENGSH